MTHQELLYYTNPNTQAVNDFVEYVMSKYGHQAWMAIAKQKLRDHNIHHLVQIHGDRLCERILPIASQVFGLSEEILNSDFEKFVQTKSCE